MIPCEVRGRRGGTGRGRTPEPDPPTLPTVHCTHHRFRAKTKCIGIKKPRQVITLTAARHIGSRSVSQTICWSAAFGGPGHGRGSSGLGGSMGDASPPSAPAPARSPRHQRKRRRLSRLLDRLAVHFRNNNHYPCPRWLALDTPTDAKEPEDVPLDLSVKSETVPRTGETGLDYACATCGQTFAVRDRLAKHVASRHRNRAPTTEAGPGRSYECEVCFRKFARSDMLTRHARLHSGVKPYACAACGQVFSRSDHLATHQRTHTGEKPYRCPVCAYAACRRDMITRHMRTHARRSQPAPA